MRVYITGDCHGNFSRFSTNKFPDQKELTREDVVIVLGDCGVIWDCGQSTREELYWLKWLEKKNFTVLFVDGNHENFDRLKEFPVVDLFCGKAHKIRDNIYHLMRGYVFTICGKKFFAFGGASSHDICDGIIDPADFKSSREMNRHVNSLRRRHKLVRILNIDWWEEELPSDGEMKFAEETLAKNDYKADYVISHCCPQSIVACHTAGEYAPDKLTIWFEEIAQKLDFKHWYFGHYHSERDFSGTYHMRYKSIERIL